MFGVSERPKRSGQPYWYGRNAFFIFLFVSLAAGPVFFAYALVGALYRDVSVTRLDHLAASLEVLSSRSTAAGQQSSQSPHGASKRSNEDPLMAYRRLRESAKSIEIATAPTQSMRPANARRKTFRTVCVRLCDGYYFPIGFSATEGQFAEHEAACQSRCGSPARLFVYPNPGASPDQMRDLAGNPYLKLKNAFRYHVNFNPSCSCQPQPWTLASRQRHRLYARVAQENVRSADVRTHPDRKSHSSPRLASLEAQGLRRDHSAVALPEKSGRQTPASIQEESLTGVLEAKKRRAVLLSEIAPTSEQWAQYMNQQSAKRRRVAVAGWSKRKKKQQLSASEILRRNIEHRF
jgi:Protein of unknown function (DUF2865)